MKHFYLHGMHSAKGCKRYHLLCSAFSELDIIDLEYLVNKNCEWNLDSLHTQISSHLCDGEKFSFFANSLGAFYAMAFGVFVKKASVSFLFNPVINPYIQLKKHLGLHKNNTTQNTFIFSKENLESYKNFIAIPDSRLVVFLANNDELIDSNESRKYFANHNNIHIVDFCGNHNVRDFKPFRAQILDEIYIQ